MQPDSRWPLQPTDLIVSTKISITANFTDSELIFVAAVVLIS